MERYVRRQRTLADRIVFTKVKGSVDDGHRFENLAWRLWHQQSQKKPATQLRSETLSAMPMHKPLGAAMAIGPPSEAELSTDESAFSEDGDGDLKQDVTSGQKENEFSLLMPSPKREHRWADELAELARDVRIRRSDSSLSDTARREDHALTDDEGTLAGTMTRGSETPISTAGSATPHAGRSRTNSVNASPRGSVLSPTRQDAILPLAATSLNKATSTSAPPVRFAVPPPTDDVSPTSKVPAVLPSIQAALLPAIVEKAEKPVVKPTQTTQHMGQERENVPHAPRMRRTKSNKSSENLGLLHRGYRSNSRTNVLNMLTMTSSDDMPKKEKLKKKKKSKIMFTVGADSDEEEHAETKPAPPRQAGGDDDEWSSEDEEEETKRREAARAAERERKRLEEEKERMEMFKKRPLRSASMADLTRIKNQVASPDVATDLNNTRGLLSSLFQPTEAPPPRKRPSSIRPGHTLTFTQMPERRHVAAPGSRNTSTPAHIHQTRSLSSAAVLHGPTMSRSKSVLAMPVLNLTSLCSSTAAGRVSDVPALSTSSREPVPSVTSAETTDMASTQQAPQPTAPLAPHARPPLPSRTKSFTALARLSAIAHGKPLETEHRKHAALGPSVSALSPAVATQTETPSVSSEEDADDEGPSLGVRPSDDGVRIERVPQPNEDEEDGKAHSFLSPPTAMASSAGRVPMPLPSPHTTRQNMLRDELSESLRQNLLWERQSRARILGLGAPVPTHGTPNADAGRHTTSDGHVRTQNDEQSFHHKGW